MLILYLVSLLFLLVLLLLRWRARHLDLGECDRVHDPLLGGQGVAYGLILYALGLLVPLLDYWYLPRILPRTWLVALVGLVLFVAGTALRYAAYRALGRFCTARLVIRDGHRLVTGGIYRHLRHPAYLGTLLLAIGQPLLAGSALGALCLGVPLALLLPRRIRAEEATLLATFGNAYRAYMACTPALIPRLRAKGEPDMPTKVRYLIASIVLGATVLAGDLAPAAPAASPGFLVVAPDRGYQGNADVRAAWEHFRKGHLTRLVFVALGEDYEREMRASLERAVADMRREGAHDIVVLPLILSEADPHLNKVRQLLGATEVRIGPVFGRDPLAGQILEDRARALSRDPHKERLVVIGFGATTPEEGEAMTRDLKRLTTEVQDTLHFADTAVAVFYHGYAADGVRTQGNALAEVTILRALDRTDFHPVVVPLHLGFKHTGSMRLGGRIESLLTARSAAYDGREVLPDPLVARWMRKVASQYIAPRKEDLGIVVMPHGSGEYHNAAILAALEPLRRKHNLEVAFGMADTETLQAAVDAVEARGARRILVLRLYDISRSLKADTEYVLGLTNTRGPMSARHAQRGSASRVRSGAVLATAGGFDDHPLISQVLLERVLAVSREPSRETVLLLAHGAGKDEDDRFWLEQMKRQAEYIRAKAGRQFRAVKVATVREDWPDKREAAVAEVRRTVAEASQDGGRVLVISNRIAGAGPYRRFLAGLDYVLNSQGIAPHPNLTRWVEEQIEGWIESQIANR